MEFVTALPGAWLSISGWGPGADIFHAGETWFVKMELAGIYPDDFTIAHSENKLLIHGRRKDRIHNKNLFYHSMEIIYSRFERVIELPFTIDGNNLCWVYRDGMLLIKLEQA